MHSVESGWAMNARGPCDGQKAQWQSVTNASRHIGLVMYAMVQMAL